jgi:hypothetical protein
MHAVQLKLNWFTSSKTGIRLMLEAETTSPALPKRNRAGNIHREGEIRAHEIEGKRNWDRDRGERV